MFDAADWSYRGDYITRHGVRPEQADEAIADPERVVLNPDPASRSGHGVRVIGNSPTLQAILTVIILDHDGITVGVNAWKANKNGQRYEGTETS